ncbi:hypothetical protein AY601_3999 [Pedobacter cryoconitis]|uniref:Dual-action HEIGH metallo-peptidase n=1 Tax=Pedobacter cryoconitis TaxID=188932 RepID=A0A127VI33_9SPHI|nr:M57 family metalloprotease [Pedobacter cryoconitis]AMQ00851.1 hypothetical protein AY601_3999 [Pedobacter cryoconitis]
MKKNLYLTLLVVCVISFSCKKKTIDQPDHSDKISADVIESIKKKGFNTDGIIRYKDGYIVEGDIFFDSKSLLKEKPESPVLNIAKSEQYKTYNLVSGTARVITISCNLGSPYSEALDQVISNYNALQLRIIFQRAASGANINVAGMNQGRNPDGSIILGISAGFPDINGNPAPSFSINTNSLAVPPSTSIAKIAEIMQHEIGHAIGLRHTDYMTRASCGRNVNETETEVGAALIPGTPSGYDYESYMLACTDMNGQARIFNANDIIALKYLYGGPERIARTIKSISFNNVFLRMSGLGLTQARASGGGVVNCQYGATVFEKFYFVPQSDGSYLIESAVFPNVFLRLDGAGVQFGYAGGTVNAQYGAGPYEKFLVLKNLDDSYSIWSTAFYGTCLQIDGNGVTQPDANGSGAVKALNLMPAEWESFTISPAL